MTKIALTIAGSDPSGGAGLQADLKTFHQLGVFGTSVITLLTAQNTEGVSHVELLSPDLICKQLHAVLTDLPPAAAKTGALGSAEMIERIAHEASQFDFPLIVDPVMISKHGHPLLKESDVKSFRKHLLPHAFLITPNRLEANQLTGMEIQNPGDCEAAIRRIQDLGAKNVLLKFGQYGTESLTLLGTPGDIFTFFETRIHSRSMHGTGCVLSASITARLALQQPLIEAVKAATRDVHRGILSAPKIGKAFINGTGFGPIDMTFGS
jgi:hydroxymethylpyrimidine/phosphomethylpyrimidine kinase